MKNKSELVQREIIKIASQMIDRQINLLEGCRILRRLSLGIPETDRRVFSYILGVEAETDEIPLGEAREKWVEAKQIEFDKKEKQYLKLEGKNIITACKEIKAYFSAQGFL